MPDCILETGLHGTAPDAVGIPTRLLVYARVVSGSCSSLRLSVSHAQGGVVLFSGDATPDSNGTASISFPVEPPVFPCGFELWVEAECLAGGTCSTAAAHVVQCKDSPHGDPPDGPGGGGDGGDDGGGLSWPWPLPPELFCPLIGKSFTTALLFGLVTILTSVAFGITGGVAAGLAVVAAAFAILAVWRIWCAPDPCSVWGAVLWAFKRAFLGGAVLALAMLSFETAVTTLGFGMVAGVLTGRLRRDRCELPSASTPLQQLPLW